MPLKGNRHPNVKLLQGGNCRAALVRAFREELKEITGNIGGMSPSLSFWT